MLLAFRDLPFLICPQPGHPVTHHTKRNPGVPVPLASQADDQPLSHLHLGSPSCPPSCLLHTNPPSLVPFKVSIKTVRTTL